MGSSSDPVGRCLSTICQEQREGGMVSQTKKHLLSNKAPKLSYLVDRVPFPQDKFQLVCARAFLTILKNLLRVEIMGNEIR